MKRTFLIAAALATLALALAPALTNGIAATKQASAVPAKLVGAWNRNVTQANYDKYGQGQEGFLIGVWTMVVKKSGGVNFYTPGAYKPGCISKHTCFPDFSVSFGVTARQLALTSTDVRLCTGKVTYGWRISGQSLTLKVIAETQKACAPLEALLEGGWKQTRL